MVLGISIIASAVLLLELVLIRIFDVILSPNMSYMVVTSALFSFGLSGVYATIKPVRTDISINALLSRLSIAMSVSVLLIYPILNFLPFDYEKIPDSPILQLIYISVLYLSFSVQGFIFMSSVGRFDIPDSRGR